MNQDLGKKEEVAIPAETAQKVKDALVSGLGAWIAWAGHWRDSHAYGNGMKEYHPDHQAEIDKIKESIRLLSPAQE